MNDKDLTTKTVLAMFAGTVFGMILKFLPDFFAVEVGFIGNVLNLAGNIFISLIKLLVVPIVLVSIICGVFSLKKITTVGSIGIKAFKWFVVTTSIAVLLALIISNIFQIGVNLHFTSDLAFKSEAVPSLWKLLNDIVPDNIFKAMAEANMLQLIVFSLLFGIAVNIAGEAGRRVGLLFVDLDTVLMKFIMLFMNVAPYGVFCLIASLFANQGFDMILGILNYFLVLLSVLILHTIITYSILLHMHKLSPRLFFHKFYPVILFAFSTSSSNASIPITLDVIKNKLGVDNAVSSFVIPLGVNMNKNGTAIMQGVAAVFISNAYHVDIGVMGNFVLFFMIVLGSIGTAGVPSVGLVTLVMILKQINVPTEGIALILGVDRLLDMVRTTVNVTGNAVIACLVGEAENQLDHKIFQTPE